MLNTLIVCMDAFPNLHPNVPLQYFVMRACRKSVAVHVTAVLAVAVDARR
jgi:hypothetical protein